MVFISGGDVFLLYEKHFQDFYPMYGPKIKSIINQNCSVEFENYLNKNATCTDQWLEFGWKEFKRPKSYIDCAGYMLLNCIIDALPETSKSDMTSAGTFLGLLPVILAMIGSTTADVGLLALRRPLLVGILGLASPAVNPMRFIDWKDPFEILRLHRRPAKKRFKKDPWRVPKTIAVTILEYLLAVLALGNLAGVAVDLTKKAIICNQPNRDYQVLVWALWAFALHLAGYVSLLWRVKLTTIRSEKKKFSRSFFISWFLDSITPSDSQSPATISMQRETTNRFIGLAWAASLATVVHIAYGSQNFAQMMFLSGGEGMQVLCRCMASVVLCRIILVYELQGMGNTVTIEEYVAEGVLDQTPSGNGSLSVLEQGDTNESGIALVKTSYQRVQAFEGV